MLKHGEVNPLAVFGLRELEHCPPHFTTVDFDLRTTDKTIRDWIWSNLAGRFYMDDHYFRNTDNQVHFSKRAGFEIAGEASMFALVLDQINSHDTDIS
jgi:hypothetical protein